MRQNICRYYATRDNGFIDDFNNLNFLRQSEVIAESAGYERNLLQEVLAASSIYSRSQRPNKGL